MNVFLLSKEQNVYHQKVVFFSLFENGEILEFILLFNSGYKSLAKIFKQSRLLGVAFVEFCFLLMMLFFLIWNLLQCTAFIICICENSRSQEGNSSWHTNLASTAINYFAESVFCYFLWSCSIFVCAVEEITWQNHQLIFLFVYVPANGC